MCLDVDVDLSTDENTVREEFEIEIRSQPSFGDVDRVLDRVQFEESDIEYRRI
jgi:hypothetical protein